LSITQAKKEPKVKIVVASVMVDNQEKALHFYTNVLGFEKKEDIAMGHRRLLFMLLRIILPVGSTHAIDDVERAGNLKEECVEKHQFEDAARWLHKQGSGFAGLTAFVKDDLIVQPTHLQRLFDELASESQ
jgi:catechol 2,3-dioxygenase-like lactoylglutathione lyase family enzyme